MNKFILTVATSIILMACSSSNDSYVEPLTDLQVSNLFNGTINLNQIDYIWGIDSMLVHDYSSRMPDFDNHNDYVFSRKQYVMYIGTRYSGEEIPDTLKLNTRVVLNFFDTTDDRQAESYNKFDPGPVAFSSLIFLPSPNWTGDIRYYNINRPYILFGAYPKDGQDSSYNLLYQEIRNRFDDIN